jgi:predicted transcriptional regulator
MTHEPKTDQLSIRLEPELRQRLERVAEADRRPLAALARNVLADFVDGRSDAIERRGEAA